MDHHLQSLQWHVSVESQLQSTRRVEVSALVQPEVTEVASLRPRPWPWEDIKTRNSKKCQEQPGDCEDEVRSVQVSKKCMFVASLNRFIDFFRTK